MLHSISVVSSITASSSSSNSASSSLERSVLETYQIIQIEQRSYGLQNTRFYLKHFILRKLTLAILFVPRSLANVKGALLGIVALRSV